MAAIPNGQPSDSIILGQTLVAGPSASRGAQCVPASISGRFQIGAELGAGGMGRVFRAFDLELDEEVALKILHSSFGTQPAHHREQLRREVKAMRRIASPHVVRIYDCGIDSGTPWFSMELLKGGSVAELLRTSGRLPADRIAPIGVAICLGLTAAHRAQVIHRDLKPSNVLVSGERVSICDFGLAQMDWHLDHSRSAVGTPAYFAPEQMNGGRVTPATDLFALGVMLYELATGQPPWVGNTLIALAMARVTEPIRDPRELAADLPEHMARTIVHCLQSEPEQRPRSAAEVAERLVASKVSGGIALSPLSAPESTASLEQRRAQATPRLIVLPFASIGPPLDLALGLAEDITAALIPHKQLRAVAARVARNYADEQRDPAEIGRSLGVDYVVDGSVRKLGAGVRIQVTLTACSSGNVVWNRTLDCDEARTQQIHDEIAFGVAQELIATAHRVTTTPHVTDPEVLRAYLSGRRSYNEAMAAFSPTTLQLAIGHFERAAGLAPNEPLIAAGLAIAVSGQLVVEAVLSSGLLSRARRLAQHAIELAPNSGEAWLARGLADLHDGQPVAAAVAFRRAVSLAPSLPEPRSQLAALLVDVGWLAPARQQLEVALELGGDAAAILGTLARIAVLEGDEPARERLRKQVELRGLPPFASWRGEYSGALAINNCELLRATYLEMIAPRAEPLPPFIDALRITLGSVVHETPPDEHLALLPRLAWNEGATAMRRVRSILLWMELRKGEAAPEWCLEVLDRAMQLGLCNTTWFERSDCLVGIRGRPEFAALRLEMERRKAGIVDAYCGDAISQPAKAVTEASDKESF